jgi:hypothetical protein
MDVTEYSCTFFDKPTKRYILMWNDCINIPRIKRSKDRQYNGQKKNDKQWYAKHYTDN